MYILEQSSQFKKDLKRYANNKEKLIALRKVLLFLETQGNVPGNYRPHPLAGKYSGAMECHIQNDYLIIWKDENSNTIKLLRLGSHSELFK